MFEFDHSLMTLTLAQDGAAPSIPGEARTTSPGSPGNGTEGGSPPGLFGPNFILLLFLGITLMIVFSILGQRREKKRREAMIGAIKKHDKVQTIGGVIGSIVELKPDFVVLKVDESSNTRITFARSAVQQVIKSSNAPAEVDAKLESQ
jgi:preprotein translocase subunit YajC